LRVPEILWLDLVNAAADNHRSVNQEIVMRIQMGSLGRTRGVGPVVEGSSPSRQVASEGTRDKPAGGSSFKPDFGSRLKGGGA
jgi:hypothetical protein